MATDPAVGFVATPVATLWSDPASDCVVSQLLLGERVLVEEVRPDGWARVVAVEQPAARLDPRGYPGWLPPAQLAFDALPEPSLVVEAVITGLRDRPGGQVVLPGVALGTRLATAGPPVGGYHPVHVPGQDRPLWASLSDLAPPTAPDAAEMLALARRLLDTVYLWGGMSVHGIDCSGLVHLAWRRSGVRLPRDASDQADATEPVPPGTERPGDLYFFARPGRPVHHVGFVSDRGRMLHACYKQRRVVEEPMPPERAATLVAIHRVSVVDAD
jgi:hypothetical protein